MDEKLQFIVGYEPRYLVSESGKVFSVKKNIKELKPFTNALGYKSVALYDDELKKKNVLVHRLVAQAFIPNPENKPNVNHIDRQPSNNDISNLEWCTQKENIQHSIDLGVQFGKKGKRKIHRKHSRGWWEEYWSK